MCPRSGNGMQRWDPSPCLVRTHGRDTAKSSAETPLPPQGKHSRLKEDQMCVPTHRCTDSIQKVLTADEVAFLKRLFGLFKRNAPEGDVLGAVNLSLSPHCRSCEFMFTWGYEAYCRNAPVVKKVMSRKPRQ